MKRFLAIYTGTGTTDKMKQWNAMDEATRKKKENDAMIAWTKWGEKYAKAILDDGAPLGKTKKIDMNGITDIRNMMAAYTIVQAESHEEAAKMFLEHPHFSIFPGDAVEIMECLPMPQM
ncbi:hypothetical protein [Bdellovibrio sp. HCB209]|uniref:hypothetical protein n=1 Tax=Bdellovibrio sp. HCB209 TaxID=3394354 RepID=UPI0039B633D6